MEGNSNLIYVFLGLVTTFYFVAIIGLIYLIKLWGKK